MTNNLEIIKQLKKDYPKLEIEILNNDIVIKGITRFEYIKIKIRYWLYKLKW